MKAVGQDGWGPAPTSHPPWPRTGTQKLTGCTWLCGFTDKGREMVKVSNGKALVVNVLGLPGNKLHLSGTSKLN